MELKKRKITNICVDKREKTDIMVVERNKCSKENRVIFEREGEKTMTAIVAEILFAALLLLGVMKREKLIAFERLLSDCLAQWIAGVIRRRRAARARKARATQTRSAALRVVRGQGAVPTGRYIA